mgnify:CR=1 FL=1
MARRRLIFFLGFEVSKYIFVKEITYFRHSNLENFPACGGLASRNALSLNKLLSNIFSGNALFLNKLNI